MKSRYQYNIEELDLIKTKQNEMSEILNKLHLSICGSEQLGITGLVQDVKEIKNKLDRLEENVNIIENCHYDSRIRRLEKFRNASLKMYSIIATFTALIVFLLTKIFGK